MRILLGLLFLTVIVACNKPVKGRNGVSYKNPAQYNDYIVNRQTDLMSKVAEFSRVAEYSIDSAAAMLPGFSAQTGVMIEEIKGMPPYKGDSSLREAAIRSFTFYKRVFEEDYADIIRIRQKGDLTQDDMDEMERIVKKITKEEESFDKAFHNAQRAFADKNNMKLRDNPLNK
jgi:hypothetical protein